MSSTPVFSSNLQGNVAELGALDKVTGRVSSVEVKVGETTNILGLEVTVKSCFYKSPEQAPDNMVFINIKELNPEEKDENLREIEYFNGWMYSSSPAVSALEHPVYDIWSIKCKNIIEE